MQPAASKVWSENMPSGQGPGRPRTWPWERPFLEEDLQCPAHGVWRVVEPVRSGAGVMGS